MLQCAITDGTAATRGAWLIEQAASLRVDLMIVREQTLPPEALVPFTRAIVAAAQGARVLVAQGQVEAALLAGAAGVHLSARQGERTPSQVRRVLAGAYVTKSCHTLEEVRHARETGADAVLFGPVFGKSVAGREVVPGSGLGLLAQACSLGIPVFALGGVTAGDAGACRAAGAVGIAGIRLFWPAPA